MQGAELNSTQLRVIAAILWTIGLDVVVGHGNIIFHPVTVCICALFPDQKRTFEAFVLSGGTKGIHKYQYDTIV
jgi:hypothetical protein